MSLAVSPPPQPAPRKPSRREVHGAILEDDYDWLRAGNWRDVLKDPSVLPGEIHDWLTLQNAHASEVLAPTTEIQKQLAKEMRGRIKEDDEAPALPDGPWLYFSRYRTGGEHALICRKPRVGGEETVLLDGDAESAGHSYFQLGDHAHSPDHRLLAWSADTQGSEFDTIHVRDLATGRDVESLAETTGSVVWLRDSQAFLYVRLDENHRDNKVYLHRLGTPQADDILLHEEVEPGFFVSVDQTQDRAFALIVIHDHDTSEVRLIDPDRPFDTPRTVVSRRNGHRYSVEHRSGRLIIRTNNSNSPDFRVVTCAAADTSEDKWEDLVPHRPGRLIAGMTVLAGHLVLFTRENAVPAFLVRTWDCGTEYEIDFKEVTFALGFDSGFEFETTTFRFTFSSLSTPQETFDFDLAARTRRLVKRREIPSGHNPEDYVVRRIEARAADGATVPVSLLHRANIAVDGSNPCLLYGYGAYGIVIPTSFRGNILSLVDRGFVFAIAHVRGGMDKGFNWYDQGRRAAKTNTFGDFIAAAEALIDLDYTAQGRIVAQGGSAGGMLMGAIANMRPELFAGIIAEVPFVDVLNTMLDKDLPLTPPEWPEWGNPIENYEDFRRIRAYSPYDNVRAQHYPAMLVEAGLTDPRVTYWEPAKWVARLRATMTGGGPVLLNTNMDAGHGGASGRIKQLADDARAYAFALAVTGKDCPLTD